MQGRQCIEGTGRLSSRCPSAVLDKSCIHSYNFYSSDSVNKLLNFCLLPLLALKMATKIITAILFMSKLFSNFGSNDICHIDFSWKKVVRADSRGPANDTWSEKVWDPLTYCKQEAANQRWADWHIFSPSPILVCKNWIRSSPDLQNFWKLSVRSSPDPPI